MHPLTEKKLRHSALRDDEWGHAVRFIIRLLFIICIVGALIGIIYQNNAELKQRAKEYLVHSFEKAWDANLLVADCSLDIIQATVTLSDVTVRSRQAPSNALKIGTLRAHLHRLPFLFDKKVVLDLVFKNTALLTETKTLNSLVNNLLTPKTENSNFSVNSISFEHISFRQREENHVFDARIIGKVFLKKQGPEWFIEMAIKQARAEVDGAPIVEKFSCNNTINIGSNYSAEGKNALTTPLFNGRSGDGNFSWNKDTKKIAFTTIDHEISITLRKTEAGFSCSGKAPIPLLISCTQAWKKTSWIEKLKPLLEGNKASGSCSFWGEWNPETEQGTACLYTKKSSINSLFEGGGACKILLNKSDLTITGRIGAHDIGIFTLAGTYSLQSHQGHFAAQNSTDITLPLYSCSIPPQQAQCTVDITNTGIAAYYSAIPTAKNDSDSLAEKPFAPLEGTAHYVNERFTIMGKSGEYSFNSAIQLGERPHLLGFSSHRNGKEFISIIENQTKKNYLEGKVSYGMVRDFLGHELQSLVLGGQGNIYILLHQGEFPNLKGIAYLKKGRLYLAGSYNLIEEAKASFEIFPDKRKALIKNMHINCHRGTLTSNNASLSWTPRYEIQSIQAPLNINNLLLNWENDFYGLATGSFLFKKSPQEGSSIDGNVILSKALINSQLLLNQKKGLLPIDQLSTPEKPIKVNLSIISNEPIAIKSNDFTSKGLINLTAQGSYNATIMQYPQLRGTISFIKGKCRFLRHNFKIKQGKIDYVPESHEPTTLEITAKSQIKKYNVTLHITGPVTKPTFHLDSQPSLTQEQIVGLLLAGSEEATLQSDFAEIIMQNVNTLLFSSEDTEQKNSILRQLTKPLEFIQITPSNNDQGGSGLKGSISANLTPQIHAKVQKELSFDGENFSCQLEYLISDEVNLKLMRDPTGALGGEAELRITF